MSQQYLGIPKLMDLAKYAYSVMLFLRRLYSRPRVFVFNENAYTYFEHPYNGTWMNERSVEIPIIWEQVQSYPSESVLEIGNVFRHYFEVSHTAVDKYEHWKGVISEDILDATFSKRFDCIVSISTFEHIGWDEIPRDPGKHLRAIERARRLLSNDGKMFVTIPLGYNKAFDQDLFSGKLDCYQVFYLKRISKEAWQQVSQNQVLESSYGRKYRTADGLAICIWKSSSFSNQSLK